MNIDRDLKGKLQRPNFVSDLPDHLLKHSTPAETYLMQQTSIGRQQNEWLAINVALDSDMRQHRVERDLGDLKTLRIIMSSKWSMIFSASVLVVIPGALVTLGVWLEKVMGIGK